MSAYKCSILYRSPLNNLCLSSACSKFLNGNSTGKTRHAPHEISAGSQQHKQQQKRRTLYAILTKPWSSRRRQFLPRIRQWRSGRQLIGPSRRWSRRRIILFSKSHRRTLWRFQDPHAGKQTGELCQILHKKHNRTCSPPPTERLYSPCSQVADDHDHMISVRPVCVSRCHEPPLKSSSA